MQYAGPDGKPRGLAIGVFEEAARREGLRVVWTLGGGFNSNTEALRKGEIDILPAGAASEERRRLFFVTRPWWLGDQVLVVRANGPVRQERDMVGHRLATAGAPPHSAAHYFPLAAIVERPSVVDAVAAVCAGEADGALLQNLSLRELVGAPVQFCRDTQLHTIDSTAVREYTLIARPELARVARALRSRIDEMALDGTLAAIATRDAPIWAHQAVSLADALAAEHERADNRIRISIALAGILVAVAFGIWLARSRERLRKVNAELQQARTELERSLTELQTVFDNLSDAVLVANSLATVVYGNQAAQRLLAFPEVALSGAPPATDLPADYELVTPEGLKSSWPIVRILRGVVYPEQELLLRHRPSGATKVLLVSGSWARDSRGNMLLAVVRARDITEARHADQALQRQTALLRAVSDSTTDSVFVKDREGRILLANPAMAEALGSTPDQVMGKTLRDFMSEPQAAALIEEERRLQDTGQVVTLEEVLTTPAGERTYLTTKAPWRDQEGNVIGMIGIARDITERKRAEVHARRWMQVVDRAEIAISVSDRERRLQQVNATYARQRGYLASEFVGMLALRLVPAAELPRFREQLELAEARGHLVFESVHQRKDGSCFPVRVDLTVVRDEQGNTDSRIAFVQDTTEEQRLRGEMERQRERLELAQRAAMLGVVEWDIRSDVVIWSEEMSDLYGLPADGPMTRVQWLEQVLPEDREKLLSSAPDAADEALVNQFRIRRADTGEIRWMESRSRIHLEEDGRPVMVGINMDITDRKMAEEEILRLNEELEERVRSRTAQLEAANRELEAFAYSVSHDLRAPLRGIDGWSLALLEDYAGHLDGTANLYLERVRGEAQRMGQLIDDLLNLSRLSRAPMRSQLLDVSALGEGVAARVLEGTEGRRIRITIEPGLTARGDRALVEVVLTNLLQNAVKFTATRAEAEIELGRRQIDGEDVFVVRDNGVGFNMAHAAKLFGAFQRLHKQSEFPGTGVGLAIVQRIVHRHGGRLWAEAQPGQGAAFYFTLEVQADESQKDTSRGRQSERHRSHAASVSAQPDRQ